MIVYDTGVLVAADRGERTTLARHAAALRRGISPYVPAAVLAQAWRGGPQPGLSRLLAGCTPVPLDTATARAAGTLCGRAGTSDVVDASVVVTAALLRSCVLSGDVEDITTLAALLDRPPPVDAI